MNKSSYYQLFSLWFILFYYILWLAEDDVLRAIDFVMGE